jgi:hypothetical protein
MILIAILSALIGYIAIGSYFMLKQISRIEDKLDDTIKTQNDDVRIH